MNRKIKKAREYRDDYRELKKQVKRHICRASRTSREHLKKIVLINGNAQINYISDVLTKKWRLQNVDKSFIKTKVFQKDVITFINIYEAKIRIRDDVACEHVFIQIFYAFSKVFQNIIIELFWIMKTNSHVHWTTLT